MSIEQAIASYNEALALAKATIIENLATEVAEILKDAPDCHSYSMYGWTPGFNDGDPCYHSSSWDYDWGDEEGKYDEDGNVCEPELYEENEKKLKALFTSIPDQIEQALWDTNFRLVITKEGINKDWYDCGY